MLRSLGRVVQRAVAAPRSLGGGCARRALATHVLNVPAMGDSITEGTVASVEKAVGDAVAEYSDYGVNANTAQKDERHTPKDRDFRKTETPTAVSKRRGNGRATNQTTVTYARTACTNEGRD